ncbi:MAG: SEL1-like repeat protein, partial [Thermoguttaceae bacterium]|nr:SEL1-like repeat protein [Thermoguttaceae bacterium]
KTNAMIFVSFSGHGFETSGEVKKAAFGTCDVAFDSSGNIKADSAILLDDVAKKLQTELPDVAFKVFVVDACRTPVGAARDATAKSIRLNLNDTTGIAYLQSCSSGQSSYELENLKQGVFTYYLLEALKKENVNGVSFTSVLGHVVTETHRHMQGKQIPAYAVNISDFWIRKPIDVDAICRRGREMLFGIGTPVDWTQARERLDDAKKKGNAGAAALLTWMNIQSGVEVSAEELYAVAFNSKAQNDPWGQWLFGYCCTNGIIVPRDDNKADEYFKKAQDLFGGEKWKKGRWQDPAVTFVDALCYMNGWGVDKNSKTARKKLEEIQSFVVAARRELALFYIKGRGGVKKVDEGIKMLKSASGIGDAPKTGDAFAAAYWAGVYLETEINYAEADRYIKRGEDEKVAKAFYYEGKRLEKGLGVPVNKGSAFEKYEQAAKRHCVEAQVRVAQCHLKGDLGKNKDEKLALEWFKRAADQNSPEALRALASSELKALMSEAEIKRYDERRKEVNAAIFR